MSPAATIPPSSPVAPPPATWTVELAQAVADDAAGRVGLVIEILKRVMAGLQLPADVEDKWEHRKAWDMTTAIYGDIEGSLGELETSHELLKRAARVTDAELAEEHRQLQQQFQQLEGQQEG